jgi:LacI family transcriptional regulator
MSQNLENIARIAGVSRSTVSRVINQHPNVRLSTRERVLQVIRENNYRPNLAARSLVTQQTRVLSLVIPQAIAYTFTDPYFPTLVQSVMVKAGEFDYAVMLWIGNSDEDHDRFSERVIRNSLFDGLLVASAGTDDPLIRYLSETNFPFLLVGPPPIDNLNYIDVDNESGAFEAVAHLVEVGWRRIGLITGPLNMGSAVCRMAGYRRALMHAGYEIDEALIVNGAYTEQSGYVAMRTLLERGVDAVFCSSDMMTYGALRAAAEYGRRVPHDLGIASFDDLPASASTNPPLTTVRQPISGIGIQATQMLIDLLSGRAEAPYQKILPAHLIVRGSSDPSRA